MIPLFSQSCHRAGRFVCLSGILRAVRSCRRKRRGAPRVLATKQDAKGKRRSTRPPFPFWCACRESNPEPTASEAVTLSNCATDTYGCVSPEAGQYAYFYTSAYIILFTEPKSKAKRRLRLFLFCNAYSYTPQHLCSFISHTPPLWKEGRSPPFPYRQCARTRSSRGRCARPCRYWGKADP